jgi:thioredoxin-related protein
MLWPIITNERKTTMKKLTYFLIVSFLFCCSTNKGDYFNSDFESVFKSAAQQNKMIFIDFYTVWCGTCQSFEKNIKYDSIFKSYMTDKFYTLQIDAELEQNKEIVSKYRPNGYPTFVITNSNSKEIDRIVGLTKESPEGFINLIESILKGNEELGILKEQYIQYPDSIELFRKVIIEKLLDRELYNAANDFSDLAILRSKDTLLIQEAKFFKAYASIKNPKVQSSKLMTDFVNETNNLQLIEYGCRELFCHYRSNNNLDSLKFYIDKLVAFESGNHLVYVRDYAKFLYENDIEIEYANSLTKEYSEYPGNHSDHWTPYLNAHRLAKQDQLKKGIEDFDHWMIEYSKPENFKEDYWHYQFYIDLILHYHVASLKAIQYAEKFESDNPSVENKKRLAELYYLNGQISDAVNKIKEIQTMIENPKEIEKYNDLIKKYDSKQ